MASQQKISHSAAYHDFIAASGLAGCPACRTVAQSVKRYLESVFYEYVNDGGFRAELIASLGFCPHHAHLLLGTRIADSLGASVIYEHIVKTILRDIFNSSGTLDRMRSLSNYKDASLRHRLCPACKQEEEFTDRILEEVGRSLHENEIRSGLKKSDGLCFPHLTQLVSNARDLEYQNFLMELTEEKLRLRQVEMNELIRKSDYRFREEGITEAEGEAWRKTMSMITGVNLP